MPMLIPTQHTQNANTNLDQDLANSRQVRYQSNQDDVKKYIQTILPEISDKYEWSEDLAEILRDGAILCKLGAKAVPNGPCKKYKNSRMPFVQMENILFFLQTCDAMGLQHDEIFQTVDLFELADPYQVIITLMSFSRLANTANAEEFPVVIGPKVVKRRPDVPVKPTKVRA